MIQYISQLNSNHVKAPGHATYLVATGSECTGTPTVASENTVALTWPCRREGDDEDILCEGLKCTCDGSVRCNREEDGREGEGTVEKLVVGPRVVMATLS
jgi:hypothetical protein